MSGRGDFSVKCAPYIPVTTWSGRTTGSADAGAASAMVGAGIFLIRVVPDLVAPSQHETTKSPENTGPENELL